jgi:hypothetical protein
MMTRRMFSASILAGAAAALLPAAARSQNSVKARNVVLVHGAYADGSSWLEVIPYLQAAGMKATAVQNPFEFVGGRCGRHEAHFGFAGWFHRSRGAFLGWHRD